GGVQVWMFRMFHCPEFLIASGVRQQELPIEDSLLALFIVSNSHPLRCSLSANYKYASIDRMHRIGFWRFLCNLKLEFRISKQTTLFGLASLDADDEIREKSFSVVKHNLNAPRFMWRIAVPPTNYPVGVPIQ